MYAVMSYLNYLLVIQEQLNDDGLMVVMIAMTLMIIMIFLFIFLILYLGGNTALTGCLVHFFMLMMTMTLIIVMIF